MANGNNPSRGPKRQPNSERPTPIRNDRPYGRAREAFQWSDIPAGEIGDFVHSVTGRSAAVILGTTSDGGALSITILDGEERIRDWPSNRGEFERLAAWVRESFAIG
jgi:hypothetical protein